MTAHFEHEDRSGENQPDPETPCHVGEFGAGAAVGRHHQRLQRHAADRAASRPVLPDLGMHRAGPDRALGRFRYGRRFPCKISRRVRLEFRIAGRRAEIVSVAPMGQAMFCGLRVDLHPADRVRHKMRMTRMVMIIRMVPMLIVSVHSLTRRLNGTWKTHRFATLPNSAFSPSAIVGCARTASRRTL